MGGVRTRRERHTCGDIVVRIAPRALGEPCENLAHHVRDDSHGTARAADGSRLKVVHRDLCPANLLLSKNGEVKISDFGVARALREADSTHTRTVAGHAGYMAPEQALAQAGA